MDKLLKEYLILDSTKMVSLEKIGYDIHEEFR